MAHRPPTQRTPLSRRARHLPVVLAGILLVLAATAGVAAADPNPDEGFGYNVQSLVRPAPVGAPAFTPDQWPTYLGAMVGDGLHVARTDALWRPAEPNAPVNGVHAYDWRTTDAVAAGLARAGVRWDAVLSGSPAWASATPSNAFAAPSAAHVGDFAAFAGAFARRYGTGGSFWAEHPELPTVPIHTFEIWNEPNTAVHWGSAPDPAAFAALFAAARAAIDAAVPGARVLVGGIVWNDDVAYIDGFFAALGPGVPVDGLGSHPYAPTVFSLVANVVRVRSALDRLGRTDVPLEINELGWPAAYDRAPAAHALDGPVSDGARAATMALTIDALAHSTCGVGSLHIYDLVEGEDNPGQIESLMGLYRRSGARTLTGDAYAAAVGRFRAAQVHPGPPVAVCGTRGAPATRVLPLAATAAPAAGGCLAVAVSYRGLPLEEAQVRAISPFTQTVATDADGRATVCPPAPVAPGVPVRVSADVPGVAGSNVVACTAGACRAIGPAAACVTTAARLAGSRRLSTVLRRGLKVTTAACAPQLGGTVRIRTRLILSRAVARRSGLMARAATVAIGEGAVHVAPGQQRVFRTRFTPAARRALRGRRQVAATVEISVREGATYDTTTRPVILTR